jgi:hypothetical protein
MKTLFLLLIAPAALSSGAGERPQERLAELLRGASSHAAQAIRLVDIAFLQKDDPEVAALARQQLPHYGRVAIRPLAEAFPRASTESRRDILVLAGKLFPELKGTDQKYLSLLRQGLTCDDSVARREALSQIGSYRLYRLALPVADAYFLHPEDAAEALATLGRIRARAGISPALDALESGDEALRSRGIETLARIGRPAALALKERMIGDDPALARDAARALLGFAGREDLAVLHEYAERYGSQDEEMGRRVTRAIAEIEADRYTPPAPDQL